MIVHVRECTHTHKRTCVCVDKYEWKKTLGETSSRMESGADDVAFLRCSGHCVADISIATKRLYLVIAGGIFVSSNQQQIAAMFLNG